MPPKTFNPPLVPDGIYRIRSAERASPHLYLERESDSEVRPVQLNATNTNQQWRITHQSGIYQIVNVATGASLSILAYNDNGTQKWRIYSGGPQSWTLDARGEGFIIGDPDSNRCVDIAVNDWVIMWDRRNAINQQWILEIVSKTQTGGDNDGDETGDTDPALPKAGTYKLVNFHTRAHFYPSFNGADWRLIRSNRLSGTLPRADSSWWTVTPSSSGTDNAHYTISGYSDGLRGYLLASSSPGVGTYAMCEPQSQTVRIIASKNFIGAYNIIVGSGNQQKTFLDKNSTGKAGSQEPTYPAYLGAFDATDNRQAWLFVFGVRCATVRKQYG